MLFQIEEEAHNDNGEEKEAPGIVQLAPCGHKDECPPVKIPCIIQYFPYLFHLLSYASKK
jgi:hypothetical protein